MEPLSESAIQRAIRHLDAGDWPDRATVRTALLMAGALRATQAESARLRETIHRADMARDSAHAALAGWVGDAFAHRKTAWVYLILEGATDADIDQAIPILQVDAGDVARLREYCTAMRALTLYGARRAELPEGYNG